MYKVNRLALLRECFSRRKGVIALSKHLKQQSAVVVFSGGQDSTTCLGWAKQTFGKVVAISFNYGQKHSIELQQASKIAKMMEVEH